MCCVSSSYSRIPEAKHCFNLYFLNQKRSLRTSLIVSSRFAHPFIIGRRSCGKFAAFENGKVGESEGGGAAAAAAAAATAARLSRRRFEVALARRSLSQRRLVFSRPAAVTLTPHESAPHLPVFLSVVTSTLIAALLLTVSGVMISEWRLLGVWWVGRGGAGREEESDWPAWPHGLPRQFYIYSEL